MIVESTIDLLVVTFRIELEEILHTMGAYELVDRMILEGRLMEGGMMVF